MCANCLQQIVTQHLLGVRPCAGPWMDWREGAQLGGSCVRWVNKGREMEKGAMQQHRAGQGRWTKTGCISSLS